MVRELYLNKAVPQKGGGNVHSLFLPETQTEKPVTLLIPLLEIKSLNR